MLGGQTYRGQMFIDATYEGDLMAAAGVAYHVGREASSTYGEKWNGVQVGVLHHRHHFGVLKQPIDPYVVPGDPSSGLLPRISPEPPGTYGEADKKVQAYCFRMCLTDHPENRVPFPQPPGYDARQYELLLRIFQAGWRETFDKFDPIPNHKTDTNNHGPFSTDNIGYNYDYPEASYERRREIIREHRDVPAGADVLHRQRSARAGRCADGDEQVGPGPRRVRRQRALAAPDLRPRGAADDRPVRDDGERTAETAADARSRSGWARTRWIRTTSSGTSRPRVTVQNEGDIGVGTNGPYEIAFGSIQPQKDQCQNLLVPVCVSSSHIAFGSIRMEPVFMILGQSAATAAVLAIDAGSAVQDVGYAKLRERLLQDGQVLESKASIRAGSGAAP